MLFPATANLICDKVGAKNAFGYDILAACSGFVYALVTGAKYVESGTHKKVVIVGADKMSSIVDYTDRGTCILFGDGAGAAMISASTNKEEGIIDLHASADGAYADFLVTPAPGCINPVSQRVLDEGLRTKDIMSPGKKEIRTSVMGDAIISKLK